MPIGRVTTRKFNPKFSVSLVTLYDQTIRPTELGNSLRSVVSDPVFHQFIGQRIVDRIIERTESGIDMFGAAFKSYSQSYKSSLIYQIYKDGSGVNLRLKGDMLEDIVSNVKDSSTIVISLSEPQQQKKAGGHMNGIKRGSGRVQRQFLGLPDGELKKIMKESVSDFRSSSPAAFSELFI